MPETPLRSAHEGLGARFRNFGGWEMPLSCEDMLDGDWRPVELVNPPFGQE